MSELSHLDQLEAEAIYIIREVAASCEKPESGWKDQSHLTRTSKGG